MGLLEGVIKDCNWSLNRIRFFCTIFLRTTEGELKRSAFWLVCVCVYIHSDTSSVFCNCFRRAYHHIISFYSPQKNKVEKLTRVGDVCTCVLSCLLPIFPVNIGKVYRPRIHFLISFSTLGLASILFLWEEDL